MKHRLISFIVFAAFVTAAFGAEAPRYIFYFIGDGMGMSHVMAAEAYNRTVLKSDTPVLMLQFPVASMCTTYSASSPVTDSAAAGTALATGSKTNNSMLGMTPDSVAVYSIARDLSDLGYGVALVTSVAPDDATPGAFYAHVPSRSMYYEIGKQYAESGFDFLAGSRLRGIKDKNNKDTDLLDVFARNNIRIAHGLEELSAFGKGRTILLNPRDVDYHQIHFTIDSVAGAMKLPDMTEAALERMRINGRDKFFIMVEGGNIDYGGHANDGGTIIKEMLNFNQALRHAYDFYLQHPDETLIVVTADHETGGFGLGNNDVGYDLHLAYIDSQRISKDMFTEYCRSVVASDADYEWEDMRKYICDKLGFWRTVPVTESQENCLMELFNQYFKKSETEMSKTEYNSFDQLTQEVFKIMDRNTGLGFTTNTHTGTFVPVFAIGVGAEEFIGVSDNISIPAKLRRIAGIVK